MHTAVCECMTMSVLILCSAPRRPVQSGNWIRFPVTAGANARRSVFIYNRCWAVRRCTAISARSVGDIRRCQNLLPRHLTIVARWTSYAYLGTNLTGHNPPRSESPVQWQGRIKPTGSHHTSQTWKLNFRIGGHKPPGSEPASYSAFDRTGCSQLSQKVV